jgi:hypothetical protein
MTPLVGTPSDDAPAILATGRTDVTTIFVSMSRRHPGGDDASYLAWHSRDHRPEQHRLASLRASFRVVSTPACRAARAASSERYDAVDHVVTYLFAGIEGLVGFRDLSAALRGAGRVPYLLPPVERGVYRLDGVVAAPRAVVGADVLPWWPARGVYLLIERGGDPAAGLVEAPGVAGAWWGVGDPSDDASADTDGLRYTCCFLDDDPVRAAVGLRPVLRERWDAGAIEPLFAAPFHALVPNEWDRYLP